MDSRFDHVAFLLRARYAVLGVGTLSIRKQGSVRTLMSVIPFPDKRCYVQEKEGRVIGSFLQQRNSYLRMDLGLAHELHRFMTRWDLLLMRSGFGASYVPVAALAFLDTLVFAEGLKGRDIFVINPQAILPAGFALSAKAEWTAPAPLVLLAREYASKPQAMPETRAAANKLLALIENNEEEVFSPVQWYRRWMLHILMDACRNGREIASEHGVWREVLAPGGMRLALAYLAGAANPSSPSKKSAAVQTAMATHFGIFMSHAKTGGCDLYLLWSAEGTPTALAAVAADGTHVSVSVPTGGATFDRETAVGMLAETVGVASPPPGSLSRSRGGGV